MSRYDHALNRIPKLKKSENVKVFGLDDHKFTKRPFYRESARIAIIINDPSKIFVGTYVHWYDHYFLCKSQKNYRAICCQKLQNRIYRIACVILKYNGASYEIMPWCFGKSVFDSLKIINNTSPIGEHDLSVKRKPGKLNIYDIEPIPDSIWQNNKNYNKDKILLEADRYRGELKSYLGADLTNQEIENLLYKK